MARKRKPARRGFKHTREFIDDNGKPDTYIERRGLREFKTPASKQARAKLLPRAQVEEAIRVHSLEDILRSFVAGLKVDIEKSGGEDSQIGTRRRLRFASRDQAKARR